MILLAKCLKLNLAGVTLSWVKVSQRTNNELQFNLKGSFTMHTGFNQISESPVTA